MYIYMSVYICLSSFLYRVLDLSISNTHFFLFYDFFFHLAISFLPISSLLLSHIPFIFGFNDTTHGVIASLASKLLQLRLVLTKHPHTSGLVSNYKANWIITRCIWSLTGETHKSLASLVTLIFTGVTLTKQAESQQNYKQITKKEIFEHSKYVHFESLIIFIYLCSFFNSLWVS